jgi:hypothetical protein
VGVGPAVHLAVWAVTPDGNPAGVTVTIPIDLAGPATANRTRPPDQATQDRSGPSATQDDVLLAQQERLASWQVQRAL